MLPDQTAARLAMASSDLLRGLEARRRQICRPVVCLKRDTSFLRHEENCYTEGGRIHLNRLRPCQSPSAERRDSEDQKVLFLLEFMRSFAKLLFRSADISSTRRSTHEEVRLDVTGCAEIAATRRGDELACSYKVKEPTPSGAGRDVWSDRKCLYESGRSEFLSLTTLHTSYRYDAAAGPLERDVRVLNDLLSDTLRVMTTAPHDATLTYENKQRGVTYQAQDVVLRFSNFG